MSLKKTLGYLAPSVVRASTFHLDRQWGILVTLFAHKILPSVSANGGVAAYLLQTIVLTLLLVFFEKWMNGDLKFWAFSFAGGEPGHRSAGDPDVGVLKPGRDGDMFF